MGRVARQTVDLSAFPDLVVIYLGMGVNGWAGIKRLLGLGPQIKNSVNKSRTACYSMRTSWRASILARL